MSERLRQGEQLKNIESTSERNTARAEKAAEKQPEKNISLEEARRTVEGERAVSSESVKQSLEGAGTKAPATPQPANRELKKLMFDRTLNKVQHRLPTPERVLSKVIHQPAVDKLSDISSKTIARPSGILSGGIFALVGSVLYLYITKHGGYDYNYFLFFICFVAGFVFGLFIELLMYLAHASKRKERQ